MKEFNAMRLAFEEVYIRKGFGTEADLDFYLQSAREASLHPERCGFASYVSKEANELFAFFMAGANTR